MYKLLVLSSSCALVHASVAAAPAAPSLDSGLPEGAVKQGQTMTIEAPSLTEEDQYGYNLPEQYKCNACRAITHHLNATLTTKAPKTRQWKQWEVMDTLEQACQPETFEGYGLKKRGGKNVLSGPALKEDDEELQGGQASIQMGGESWKKRLAEECRKMVNDKFDDEIYDIWKQGKLNKALCYEHGFCEAKKKTMKVKSAKKKVEKKPKAEKKVEKRISVEAYFQKLARSRGLPETEWTKPRSDADWVRDLKKMFETLEGKKEEL